MEENIEEIEISKTKNLNDNKFTKIPLMNFSEIDKFLNLTSLLVGETRNLMETCIKKDANENSLLKTEESNEINDNEIPSQIKIYNFFAECLDEGNIEEAIILTKENFDLPDNYKMKVNLEITFAENAIIKVSKK